jgi:hypothetical protein
MTVFLCSSSLLFDPRVLVHLSMVTFPLAMAEA